MSTVTDNSSLPDLPEELSCGSSVSTAFVNDYEEILKHAIVAPKFQLGEDVYRRMNQTDIINKEEPNNYHRETYEENSSSETSMHYTIDMKISEAKQAVEKKRMTEKKHLRFNVPNALDSLLGMKCILVSTMNIIWMYSIL